MIQVVPKLSSGSAIVGNRLMSRHFTIRVQQEDRTGPGFELLMQVHDGRPQCREVRVTSQPSGREVQNQDLRVARLEDWIEQGCSVFGTFTVSEEGTVRSAIRLDPESLKVARKDVRAVRRDGRRKISDELLRQVAEVYRANVDDRPTAAVAD